MRSFIAWPTILVFVGSVGLFIGSTYSGITELWPIWISITLNCIASFLAFTVLHEASHYLVCKNHFLNNSIGQVAMLLLSPVIGFKPYRDVHAYHHLHTNHSIAKDPDFWLATGPKYLYMFKWMLMDSYYFYFYVKHQMMSSVSNFLSGVIAIVSFLILVLVIYTYNWEIEFLLYSFIPSRIAAVYLIWSFAYLPHKPHKQQDNPDPIKTTNIYTGNEAWLTPLFMSHNFHLIHHLYPSVPFYRYRQVWDTEKANLKQNQVQIYHHFKRTNQ